MKVYKNLKFKIEIVKNKQTNGSIFFILLVSSQVLWHAIDEFHGHEELSELLDWERLWIDLIHAAANGSLDVLVLYMAGDSHDLGLLLPRDVHA